MTKLLIVEDDENLRVGLQDNLEEEGYAVVSAPDGETARALLRDHAVDLIVLDIMLPDSDGYTLCRELRANGYDGMILMLTARTLEEDIVRGFDAGANDYVSKPYRIAELLARARALLRRSGGVPTRDTLTTFGEFHFDPVARVVRRAQEEPIELTRTEFDLLEHFLEHAGRALHREDILDAVWGEDVIVDGRTVDNFVSSLKKKLGWRSTDRWRITTIRGVGFEATTSESPT